MIYNVEYMERPKLTFAEIPVLTTQGSGFVAGEHTWNPITVSFSNADQVYDHHAKLGGGYFDLVFETPEETWALTRCLLKYRCIPRTNEFVITYEHARQLK